MKILYCKNCQLYTLEQACRTCKSKTVSRKPAKFSIEDKLGKWRRMYKTKNYLNTNNITIK